jgi:hypothetical protein
MLALAFSLVDLLTTWMPNPRREFQVANSIMAYVVTDFL